MFVNYVTSYPSFFRKIARSGGSSPKKLHWMKKSTINSSFMYLFHNFIKTCNVELLYMELALKRTSVAGYPFKGSNLYSTYLGNLFAQSLDKCWTLIWVTDHKMVVTTLRFYFFLFFFFLFFCTPPPPPPPQRLNNQRCIIKTFVTHN